MNNASPGSGQPKPLFITDPELIRGLRAIEHLADIAESAAAAARAQARELARALERGLEESER